MTKALNEKYYKDYDAITPKRVAALRQIAIGTLKPDDYKYDSEDEMYSTQAIFSPPSTYDICLYDIAVSPVDIGRNPIAGYWALSILLPTI
jgi:hypothetical protein